MAQIRAEHPDKRVLTYYQDEARFGQHGTLTRVWARVGSRPPAIRQTQYDYLYVFSAVCPETGEATGLITPHVNTGAMNAFLAQLAAELPELNPAENLWHYLRSHYWSNRLYPTWEDLKRAATAAWRAVCLVPELIKTICADTALRADQV